MRQNTVFRMYNRLQIYLFGNDADPEHRSSVVATAYNNVQRSSAAHYAVPWQAWLHSIVESPYLSNFFMMAIIVNSVLLGMESADMSPQRTKQLELANAFFTWLFAVEFGLRLLALGMKSYFGSLANSFDAVVVIISMVELLALGNKSSISALRSLKTFRVLKSFRVLRVLRAFKYLRALSMITEVLGESVGAFIAIGMLISLFLVVFAIIGLHVYGTAQLDIGFPNFHTFFGSLVIVFQVCFFILPKVFACSCSSQFVIVYTKSDALLFFYGCSAGVTRRGISSNLYSLGISTIIDAMARVLKLEQASVDSLQFGVQVMTTEDWQVLMMSTVRAGETSSYFFFLSWIILSKYVFLMLFLAVAMEAFERSYSAMDHDSPGINAILSRNSSRSSLYQEEEKAEAKLIANNVGGGDGGCSDEETLPAFRVSESTPHSSLMSSILPVLQNTIDMHTNVEHSPTAPDGQHSLLTGVLPDASMVAGQHVVHNHPAVYKSEDSYQNSSPYHPRSRACSGTTGGSSRRSSEVPVLNLANISCTNSSRASEHGASAAHASGSVAGPVDAEVFELETSSDDLEDDDACYIGSDDMQLQPSREHSSRHSTNSAGTANTSQPVLLQTLRRHSEQPTRVAGACVDWVRGRKAHSHTAVTGRSAGVHLARVPKISAPSLPGELSGEVGLLHDAQVAALGANGAHLTAGDGLRFPHWDEWDSCNAPTIDVLIEGSGRAPSAAATSAAPSMVSTCVEGMGSVQTSDGNALASKRNSAGIGSKRRTSALTIESSHRKCESGKDSSPNTRRRRNHKSQEANGESSSESVGYPSTRSVRRRRRRTTFNTDTATPEAELSRLIVDGVVQGSQVVECASAFSVLRRETEVMQLARQVRAQRQSQCRHSRGSTSMHAMHAELCFNQSSTGTVAQEPSGSDLATHHRDAQQPTQDGATTKKRTHKEKSGASSQVLSFVWMP